MEVTASSTPLEAGVAQRDMASETTCEELVVYLTVILINLALFLGTMSFCAELCDCIKQQFIKTIGLQHYTECAAMLPKPQAGAGTYTIYAMYRKTATFVAMFCKAT